VVSPKLPLKLRPLARTDIKEILKRTTKLWGSEQRLKYKNLIDDCLESIVVSPSPRSKRDESVSGYYRRHLGSRSRHYIFYKILDDRIDVVRILDDRMDFDRHLLDDKTK
jgi:toxin ParE1/3/4